jgi:hypothetical protein
MDFLKITITLKLHIDSRAPFKNTFTPHIHKLVQTVTIITFTFNLLNIFNDLGIHPFKKLSTFQFP